MSLGLSPDNQQFLNNAVEAGRFSTTADALDEAVRLLRKKDEFEKAVIAGIEQADRGELLDGESVMAKFMQRATAITAKARKQP